jgi:CheY-like chemotaxis protein
VDVVSNGREAVDRITGGHEYDLLITDMQMPEMDGYTATSLLRANGYDRPILALTAHAMEGDRERCLEAGCDEYQTKPINRASLLASIERLLTNAPQQIRARAA